MTEPGEFRLRAQRHRGLNGNLHVAGKRLIDFRPGCRSAVYHLPPGGEGTARGELSGGLIRRSMLGGIAAPDNRPRSLWPEPQYRVITVLRQRHKLRAAPVGRAAGEIMMAMPKIVDSQYGAIGQGIQYRQGTFGRIARWGSPE